jgi:glycosyltransferase involved in cell wall biosynthesis
MSDLTDVSVVVPVFNGEGYIERALCSALDQTGCRFEVIVVDDGSSDSTQSILQKFSRDVRVVRHVENRGLPAARNTGIRSAKSDVVALMDADDFWAKGKLAEQAQVFREHPEIDIVFTDFSTVDQNGEKTGWQGGIRKQLPALGLTLRELGSDVFELVGDVHYALIRHTSFMHPSGVSIRKPILDVAGYFDESMKYCEDLEMWIRLAACGKVALIDKTLVTIEARSESWGRHVTKNSEHILALYESLPGRFPDMPESVRSHVANFVEAKRLALGWQHRRAGNREIARTHYQKALRSRFSLGAFCGYWKTFVPIG